MKGIVTECKFRSLKNVTIPKKIVLKSISEIPMDVRSSPPDRAAALFTPVAEHAHLCASDPLDASALS